MRWVLLEISWFHFFVAPFCFSIAELHKLPQEHITSDIGSVGDFAAGSEVAFGTILQRTYSVLGARMHYGHPDIMNKQFLEE